MYPIFPSSVVDDIQKGFRQEKAAAKLFVLSEIYKTSAQSSDTELHKKLVEKITKILEEF